jgi:thiamine biosynthesis lipoprotein ApbE
MELVEQLEDIEAIIVDRNGRVLISSGLRNRVRLSHGRDESKLNH